jgi:hypothetical protein
MFKFAKLAVGQKSLNFAALMHAETPHFPPEERFGLTNRIRRAPAAVPSKIAEGSARSDADFSRFVGSASGNSCGRRLLPESIPPQMKSAEGCAAFALRSAIDWLAALSS